MSFAIEFSDHFKAGRHNLSRHADDRQDDAYADPLELEHTRVNIRVLKALGGVVLLAALEEP